MKRFYTCPNRRYRIRLLALALAAATSVAAPYQMTYNRQVPDYDQKRNALPADGKMYCVPTTYVNLLKFMAANGAPGMDMSYGGGYGDITAFISRLGQEMDTDPQDGTNGYDAIDVVVEWIEDHSNQPVFHYAYGSDTDFGFEKMRNWVAAGAMVRIGYGFYKKSGGEWDRDGGHAVALTGYYDMPGDRRIFVSNPNNGDSSLDVQGEFKQNDYKVTDDFLETDDDGYVFHARIGTGPRPASKMSLIDFMHVILPIWGGWVDSDHFEYGATNGLWAGLPGSAGRAPAANPVFHAVFSNPLSDGKNAARRELSVELPGPVVDWCFDPGDVAIYTLGEDGTIHRVELFGKKATKVATLKGARKLAVAGKKLDLYALQGDGAGDRLVRIEARTGKQTSIKLAKGVTSIEPDPSTLGIAALNAGEKKIFRIDPMLRSARPEAVALPEGDGPTFVALDRRGEATLVRSGGRTLVRAAGGAKATMAKAGKIHGFHAIGKGRYLVQEGPRLSTVDALGKATKGPFDAVVAKGPFRTSYTWRTFTKADVSGPKWREVQDEPSSN